MERFVGYFPTSHLAAFGCCVGYKGELYDATAAYRKTLGKVFVIDLEAVGHQFDPLHGRTTERSCTRAAKYLLYEGERDPIFIERGMKMVTQLFLAAREEVQTGVLTIPPYPMPGSL